MLSLSMQMTQACRNNLVKRKPQNRSMARLPVRISHDTYFAHLIHIGPGVCSSIVFWRRRRQHLDNQCQGEIDKRIMEVVTRNGNIRPQAAQTGRQQDHPTVFPGPLPTDDNPEQKSGESGEQLRTTCVLPFLNDQPVRKCSESWGRQAQFPRTIGQTSVLSELLGRSAAVSLSI